MRIAWMPFLVACTELAEMPAVSPPVEWRCEDAFEDRWLACEAESCSGVMAMESLIDDSTIAFTSDEVRVDDHYAEDGTLQTLRFYAITDYFRGTVDISSIDLPPEQSASAFVVRQGQDADQDERAVRFGWSASNSKVPLVATGLSGMVSVEERDDAVLATWFVNDTQSDSIIGCAYARRD